MKPLVFLLAWGVALPTLSAANWIHVRTANFELYTTAPESDARETLATFERTRDFFARVKPTTLVSQLPVTLVFFADAKEYKQYSAKSFTPAYFAGDEQGDYIVMSDLGADRERAAVHEYVHLLVRHSGLTLPVWLNEGMADVYSTMRVRDGRVVVGAIPKDRTFSLVNDRWIRLPALLAADAKSPEYNEATRAGIFYAQSWLLAGADLYTEGDYEAALIELRRIAAIAPEREATLYTMLALTAARLKREPEATGYAEEARKHNPSAAEQNNLDRIADLLRQPDSSPDAALSEDDRPPARPLLRRTAPPKPKGK